MGIESITKHQPHMVVTVNDKPHCFPVATIRDMARGVKLDDNHDIITQCIAIALLERLEDG